MKRYVATSGTIFFLITMAHGARMVVEPHVLREPFFHLLTLLAAGLSIWAWRVYHEAAAPA